MLEVVPYELDEIKNELKRKAMEEFGLSDAAFEGSNISQLINLLAYSTVINNTNFTFGLNEMFISQAKDRRNVIKHARQMGYSHKRKISYQYKIKLKVLKSGEVTLNKYSNFSSNGNNYVYFGESILDVYGTYAYIKLLTNEYNNKLENVYLSDSIKKNKFLITEEGQVCKILHKEPVGDPRLLLEIMDSKELPIYSQLGQEIFITDGTRSNGFRNLIKVGTIDTFITDKTAKQFRVQMTLENGMQFPVPIHQEHKGLNDTLVKIDNDFSLNNDTDFPINSIEELILIDGDEEIHISILSLEISDRNIKIPGDKIDVEEDYHGINDETPYYLKVLDLDTHESQIITAHSMIDDSFQGLKLAIDGKVYNYLPEDLTIDYDNDKIIIPAKTENQLDKGIDIDNGEIILNRDTNKIINSVVINNSEDDSKIIISSDNYSFTNNKVTLLTEDDDGNTVNDTSYDDDKYSAEIDYEYYVKIEQGINTITYSYIRDISGLTAKMKYTNTFDNNGYLAKRLFFSDYRGESKENENDYNAENMPNGWNGFYASAFNAETNVLYFDISSCTPTDISYGNEYHNCYVSINGDQAVRMDKLIKTPFRRTRFSFTEEIKDIATKEVIGYKEYDKSSTFASILNTDVKDELEIIVKEGTIKRWNEQTEASIQAIQEASDKNLPLPDPIYENPELVLSINKDMVEAGYFTMQNDDIENDGIELFITRVLEDGSIEFDVPWMRRDYLLAEQTAVGEKSFVAMSDVDYEDYINIFTKYAGTGTPLSIDMTVKMNILKSKGPMGSTNTLIEPVDNENFEAKYYLEETLTPNVLHIEGAEVQDTDSIRETAPLFSNTANRAVTKNDYKTICEAQQFIQSAQIWGGEEETPKNIPGHIFFSFIPYSRPISYLRDGTKYSLKNINNPELFFTSYYQITGKDRYDLKANKNDQNVLFNLLDNYKIITLQLNYVKPIYMDYSVKVHVLKYKFGQTIEETNAEMFENVRQYFVREIEKFDAVFYTSSLTKALDEKIGDDYGITLDTTFSVDLYDSLYEPDKGTFINATLTDLTDTDNNLGLIGDNDNWKFIMPLDWPIEDMFEESTIVNNVVTRRGRMIVNNITNCNTEAFIRPGDYLYMELNDGTFVSHDGNGKLEDVLANAYSETIRINIMYTRNKEDENEEVFKVGEYWIHRTQKIIRLELNTHNYWHIDAQAVVTQDMIDAGKVHDNEDGDGVAYTSGDITDPDSINDLGQLIYYKVYQENTEEHSAGDIIYKDGKPVETLVESSVPNTIFLNVKKPYTDDLESVTYTNENNEVMYNYKICPLPRESFTERKRTMVINPKNKNIKSRRNVFSRFKEIEFIS